MHQISFQALRSGIEVNAQADMMNKIQFNEKPENDHYNHTICWAEKSFDSFRIWNPTGMIRTHLKIQSITITISNINDH